MYWLHNPDSTGGTCSPPGPSQFSTISPVTHPTAQDSKPVSCDIPPSRPRRPLTQAGANDSHLGSWNCPILVQTPSPWPGSASVSGWSSDFLLPWLPNPFWTGQPRLFPNHNHISSLSSGFPQSSGQVATVCHTLVSE